jgi:hypothetical protein
MRWFFISYVGINFVFIYISSLGVWWRVGNTKLLKPKKKIGFVDMQIIYTYRVIHKSLRDFRPLRYSNRDGDAEREHVNRGRDTSIFCATLQLLDMSTICGSMLTEGEILQFSVLPYSCSICPPFVGAC